MSLTTTTLSAAATVDQPFISVSSSTGFAAGMRVIVDQECMRVINSYVQSSSATNIPVLRGTEGTLSQAHVSGANVVVELFSDAPQQLAGQASSLQPIEGRPRPLISYGVAGAIALPLAGSDQVAVINGTGALAMTLAAPTTDLDGCVLIIAGNGKAAHTVAVSGNNGIGNAGAGYRTITFAAGAKLCFSFIAVNGDWLALESVFGGTTTNLQGALS